MRKAAKAAVKFLAVSAAIKGLGFVIAKAFEGDTTASDNDFKLLAVMDGRQHLSEADALRTGSATSVMGGIDIDLTSATLDPGGAHIALKSVMGGLQLTVPKGWRVDVDVDAKSAEVEVMTPDPSAADDGAPRLFVEAYARYGGILIQTEE
jgi:hypothetical protein